MNVLIAIPARYASSRYPGKPLVHLTGSTGVSQTLIERSWRAALAVRGVSRVVVATDDARISETVEAFGGDVVMTSSTWRNGTERCAEVAQRHPDVDIIVNLQGDAPLTPPWFVEALIDTLLNNPEAKVATPVLRTDGATLEGFLEDRRADRVGGTTAVFDLARRAMYFSKEVVPFTSKTYAPDEPTPVFHHVGVYAYRVDALKSYLSFEPGPLEILEGLEQLRFMEQGTPVHCVEVNANGRQFWELNNPEDVPRLERMMRDMGIE